MPSAADPAVQGAPRRRARWQASRPALRAEDRQILRLAVPGYCLWLLARFITLVLRARGSRWLVTGAVRHE